MNPSDIKNFISGDLCHELRCLLGAATVWQAFREQDGGFDVVVAMDSAFVHARNLFNFFTGKSSHDVSITQLGLSSPYDSDQFKTWEEPLNRYVLHISKGRSQPSNVKGDQHLNCQVVPFAIEILRLWSRLEGDPVAAKFSADLAEARATAIAHARNDAGDRTCALFA